MVTDGTEKNEGVKTSQTTQGTSTATFTQTQVDEQVRKARSDALADIGRLKKASEDAVKSAQAAQARLEQMQRDQERAELEAVKDDPDRLEIIKERQEKRKLKAELDVEKQARTELDTRLKQSESEKTEAARAEQVKVIAAKLNVSPTVLGKLAKFTDGTPEMIEDIAKDLPKVNPAKGFRPDSGGSQGGSVSWEQVRDAYIKDPKDPATRQRYLEMRAERKR